MALLTDLRAAASLMIDWAGFALCAHNTTQEKKRHQVKYETICYQSLSFLRFYVSQTRAEHCELWTLAEPAAGGRCYQFAFFLPLMSSLIMKH